MYSFKFSFKFHGIGSIGVPPTSLYSQLRHFMKEIEQLSLEKII